MTKLKTLLEGFAWERKPGKPLPTLAEVQAEYEKNEAVSQSDADKRWNTDPIQMSMRKYTMPADSVLASSMSTPQKAPSNFYREKITALEAQRKQLEFDMEQEAEPEGGPIADYYGEALMHIDDQIAAIRKKMSTNESSDGNSEETRWWDSDGDGNPYEPGDDVKAESAKPDYIDADGDGDETESMKKAIQDKMNESFIGRIKKNLIGGATRK